MIIQKASHTKRPNLNDNISTKITLIQMEIRDHIKGQEICSVLTSSLNELKQPTTTKNQSIPQKQPSSTIKIKKKK